MTLSSHLPALIVVVPLFAAVLAPVIAFFSFRWVRVWSLSALVLSGAASAGALRRVLAEGTWSYHFGGWLPPWGIEYVIDPLSGAVAVLVSSMAVLTALYSWGWEPVEEKLGVGAFHALTLLLTAGLLGIVVTGDLFNLYVFLEIASLATYALVAAGGNGALLPAFRYLLVGSVGALFWVFGIGYLYALTGTLNMADAQVLWPAVSGSWPAAAAVYLIVAGLAVKMAVFPLHGWQPDAYSSAPAQVMPLVAGVVAKVLAYAMLRVLRFMLEARGQAAGALELLGWAGILTMLAGSVMALGQKDVRRLLAYSSVAQIGYLLIGFSMGGAALTGALLHLFNHAVMKSCLFMAAGAVSSRSGSCTLEDFKGLSRKMPWTCGVFAVAALAMVGLPPGCAFFSKWYLLQGAAETGAWHFAAALVAASLLSAVYFFRILEAAYLQEPEAQGRGDPGWTLLAPMLALAAAVVLLGVFNQWVVGRILLPALAPLGVL